MAQGLKFAPDLQARIEALAARTSRSPTEVVIDALEHGHSLDWQERFLDRIELGIAQADRGEFASAADVERVFSKYRPT